MGHRSVPCCSASFELAGESSANLPSLIEYVLIRESLALQCGPVGGNVFMDLGIRWLILPLHHGCTHTHTHIHAYYTYYVTYTLVPHMKYTHKHTHSEAW